VSVDLQAPGAPDGSGPPGRTDVPAIEIHGLSKTFPGQRALADVEMTILPAEIHALVGENGSGKSTLIKVLAGVYTPDPGATIKVYGEVLPPGLPRESRRLGLQFVHQALGIIGELTAVENIALGSGYRRRAGVFIDWGAQRRKTRRLLDKLSIELDLDCPVSVLRPVERAAVAVARALDDDEGGCRVLVLDEPTAALPPHEVELLFSLVRQARSSGTSVIYVSHRLNEIFELADRATVLRDAVSVGTVPVSELDHASLAHMIVGSAVLPSAHPYDQASAAAHSEEVALKVEGLVGLRLDGISFTLHAGEVLGVAGLTGSGREELAGALVGERPAKVRLENAAGRTAVDPSPRDAKNLGVVLVLPNRATGAAAADLTVGENITLPSLQRYARFGFLRKGTEAHDARRWIDALDIRPQDPERIYSLLSGGNQQKVIFGKWLNLSPSVMVIEDPTSGVDIGARTAIYGLIRAQAEEGRSFIVCSSDFEDLIAVCHRVLVLNDGRIVEELKGADIEESRLLMATLSNAGASEPAGTTA
jgi:ribose transport system ATP-binding protein